MKKWDGFDITGKYRYQADEIEEWNMQIADTGTIYYTTHESPPREMIWCTSDQLTAHLRNSHRLNPSSVEFFG